MKFRVFDKRENHHYSEAEYLIDCDGELFFHDVERNELISPAGVYFVLQFSTGLTDISGKEIFEGDSVFWAETNGETREAAVVFSPKLAQFVLDTSGRHLIDDKYGDYYPMHYLEQYKIIEK